MSRPSFVAALGSPADLAFCARGSKMNGMDTSRDAEKMGIDSLETLSREMVLLAKALRGSDLANPIVSRLASNLAEWRVPGGKASLATQVSPAGFAASDGQPVAQGGRAAEFAALLRGMGVKSIAFHTPLSESEVAAFAKLISEDDPTGFKSQYLNGSFTSIILAFSAAPSQPGSAAPSTPDPAVAASLANAQKAWLILQSGASTPEELARALAMPELWQVGGEAGASMLGMALFELGPRLLRAISTMDAEMRERTIGHLATLGAVMSVEEVTKLVVGQTGDSRQGRDAMLALLGAQPPKRLVDILAGVVSLTWPETAFAASLFNRYAAREDAGALAIIRERLAERNYRGFTHEVWLKLEGIALADAEGLRADDYECVAQKRPRPTATARGSIRVGIDFHGDAEENLDYAYLETALAGGGQIKAGWESLFARIGALAENGDYSRAIALSEKVDGFVPAALDTKPELLGAIAEAALLVADKQNDAERAGVMRFLERHRVATLGVLLKRLLESDKASERKMLVEALKGLPPSQTSTLVATARRGPWFMTRNLLIVLGKRQDPASMPYVVSAADNPDERVARQALRSLEYFGQAAIPALEKAARDTKKSEVLRGQARTILLRLKP